MIEAFTCIRWIKYLLQTNQFRIVMLRHCTHPTILRKCNERTLWAVFFFCLCVSWYNVRQHRFRFIERMWMFAYSRTNAHKKSKPIDCIFFSVANTTQPHWSQQPKTQRSINPRDDDWSGALDCSTWSSTTTTALGSNDQSASTFATVQTSVCQSPPNSSANQIRSFLLSRCVSEVGCRSRIRLQCTNPSAVQRVLVRKFSLTVRGNPRVL